MLGGQVELSQPSQLAIPGVRDVGEVRPVHDSIRPAMEKPDGQLDRKVIREHHGGVEPQSIVPLEQVLVGSELVDAEVRNAKSEPRVLVENASNSFSGAKLSRIAPVVWVRRLSARMDDDRFVRPLAGEVDLSRRFGVRTEALDVAMQLDALQTGAECLVEDFSGVRLAGQHGGQAGDA